MVDHLDLATLANSPASVFALSVKSCGFASSPKVGALGSPRKVHLFAKASPFGRGVTVGDGEGEDTNRSAALSQKAALQMKFAVTTPPVKMGFRKVRRLS